MTKNCTLMYILADVNFFFSHRIDLAKAAEKEGYNISVAAPNADQCERLVSLGYKGIHLPLNRSGTNPAKELKTLYALYKILQQNKPQLVHAIALKPALYSALAGLLNRSIPMLFLFTGLGYVFTGSNNKSKLIRLLITPLMKIAFRRKNTHCVFQNPDDMNTFTNARFVHTNRAHLIRGSGVNTEHFTPTPEPDENIKIVLPARVVGDKGVREYIAAAKLIKETNSTVRFLIAGDQDKKNPTCLTDQEIKEASSHIEFLGHCTDMKSLYRNSHIICLPSYREGLPKALLEAASAGRPIITTDVPGCREAVVHHENGLLVPVKQVQPLAQACQHLINDKTLRLKFAKDGRQKALNHFSIEQVNSETIQLYKHLTTS